MNGRELIKKLLPSGLREAYKVLRAKAINLEFDIFSKQPIKKKRVVFTNVWGYGDNPKWVAKALRSYDKSIELIFVTDSLKYAGSVNGIKFVLNNSVRAIYYLSTAHVWVDCNRKEPYIKKREGQFYIQCWHGSLSLKKLEADCAEKLSEAYLANAKRDSEMADLFLSDSEFCNELYRRAFMYDGEIALTGSPRLDPLIKPNAARIIAFKRRLEKQIAFQSGENANEQRGRERKLAVYAPTYRDGGSSFVPSGFDNPDAILAALQKRFGGEFVIITRLHPLVAGKSRMSTNPHVINGNLFGDLYSVLEAADVLITDYSNTLFEFAYTGKPVFLYAPDSEQYADSRGMYFDYESLPYSHSKTEEELTAEIEGYKAEAYAGKQQKFFADLGIREDGRASRRTAEIIAAVIYGRK